MIHEYKGMRSTRVKLVLLAFIVASVFVAKGIITGDQWVDVTLGSIIAYALSEVGVKGAHAYKTKGDE